MGRTAVKAPPPSWTPAPAGRAVLQRKCACGGSGQECRECQGGALQRKAENGAGSGLIPPLVGQVLSSPGAPLDAATRSSMEAGFGHDFSRIRVHADAPAAESARAVHAHAYSVGSHLVFGQDRYAPQTGAGRQLVAHELAHAVQAEHHPAAAQGISDPSGAAEREADRAAERVGQGAAARPVAAAPAASLHRAGDDLQDYLTFIDKGRIEGGDDSDDKAVRIVQAWKEGGSPYELDNLRRAVLINEMLDGPTTAPDEEAIVEILWRSDTTMLRRIFFASGSPSQVQIAEDVPDDEASQLTYFCRHRWVGGIDAFRKGDGEPRVGMKGTPLGEPLRTPVPGPPLEMPRSKTFKAPRRPRLFEGGTPAPEPTPATPVPTPSPFGPAAPHPGTGMDMLKAFLSSPLGEGVKALGIKAGEEAWEGTTVEDKLIVLFANLAPTTAIGLYGVIGAWSDGQRQEVWNLITSDKDNALLRPLPHKTITLVELVFDPDFKVRKVRPPLGEIEVP